MEKFLEDIFNMLVNHEQQYHSFQPASMFNEMKNSNIEKDLAFDFFHYLFTHNIIRVGLDFNNAEMPFMTFTRFGRTLIGNNARRTAIFEEFLKIYNSL